MAQAALLLTVGCGLLLSLAAARTNALLPATTRPVQPTGMAGVLEPFSFHMGVGVLIVSMLLISASYAILVAFAEELSLRLVLGAILLLNVLAVLGPPLFSTDVFSYQAYARMFMVYGVNPYTHGPTYSMNSAVPLYPYIGAEWINTPTVYGPVFTVLSGLLAHAQIATSQLVFRIIALCSSLGTVALLWGSARRRNLNPLPAIVLFGLNPLVFLFGVGGGHNDFLMLALSTAGVYATLRGRAASGGGLFALSAGVKLTSVVLAPFALLATPAEGGRRRFLLGAALVAAAIMAAGLYWFGWGSLEMISTIKTNQGTISEQSIPGLLSLVFGRGIWHVASILLPVIGISVIGRLLFCVWRGRLDWLEAAAWATVTILLTANSILPWYGAWMLPLIALCRNRRLWIVAVCLTVVITIVGAIPQLPPGPLL